MESSVCTVFVFLCRDSWASQWCWQLEQNRRIWYFACFLLFAFYRSRSRCLSIYWCRWGNRRWANNRYDDTVSI